MNIYIGIVNTEFEILQYNGPKKVLKELISKIRNSKEIKENGIIIHDKKRYKYSVLKNENKFYFSFTDLSELEDYKKLAFVDQLTGLYNRYGYWRIIERLLHECKRDGSELGVIFLDIDFLKEINLKRGYIEGDKVISGIARIISTLVRKTDYVFRLGGDEFLILAKFKSKQQQEFISLTERIHEQIELRSKTLSTISLGAKIINKQKIEDTINLKTFKKDWLIHMNELDFLVKKSKELGKNRYSLSK